MAPTRGRPRKPAHRKRTVYLQVRATADEKQLWERAADQVGLALSSWVRERLQVIALKELSHSKDT